MCGNFVGVDRSVYQEALLGLTGLYIRKLCRG